MEPPPPGLKYILLRSIHFHFPKTNYFESRFYEL